MENVLNNDVSLADIFLIAKVSLFEATGEVTALAKLIDCVEIVGGLEIFDAADHIGMFEASNDVYLFPKEVLNAHLLDLLQLNYLYRHCCIFLFLFGSVDLGKGAFSQFG